MKLLKIFPPLLLLSLTAGMLFFFSANSSIGEEIKEKQAVAETHDNHETHDHEDHDGHDHAKHKEEDKENHDGHNHNAHDKAEDKQEKHHNVSRLICKGDS